MKISYKKDVTPMPYLVVEAMLSNIGGIVTLVGDPPNIMIGSAAHIDFNTFLVHMGPVVAVVLQKRGSLRERGYAVVSL